MITAPSSDLTKDTVFHQYVIIDQFRHYNVGWVVCDRESKALANNLIQIKCEH